MVLSVCLLGGGIFTKEQHMQQIFEARKLSEVAFQKFRLLKCLSKLLSELFRMTIKKISLNHRIQGGFHLHLLVFPFIHQFNSRIGVHHLQMTSSEGFPKTFQHHFKICLLCGFYIKKNVAFTLISFAVLK